MGFYRHKWIANEKRFYFLHLQIEKDGKEQRKIEKRTTSFWLKKKKQIEKET